MCSKMYKLPFLLFIGIAAVAAAAKDDDLTPTTLEPPQPIYKAQQQSPTYQTYSDGYGLFYPMFPGQPQTYSGQQAQSNYAVPILSGTQGALQVAVRALTKFGLFVLGGTALLLIGGIFTTIICHLTSICTISFSMFGGLDKESMRSFMTPDKISAAAAMVQDAIGKYQRLQRATRP